MLHGTLLLWPSGVRDGVTSCDRIEGFNPKHPNDGLYRAFHRFLWRSLNLGRALVEVSAQLTSEAKELLKSRELGRSTRKAFVMALEAKMRL